MLDRIRRLGWEHLWSSWSARLQWAIIAIGGVWEIVPGLADYLPRWLVQALAVGALVAKLLQNRQRPGDSA